MPGANKQGKVSQDKIQAKEFPLHSSKKTGKSELCKNP